MLRDRSNGTRGQRRRQERHPRFVTSQSFRTAPQRLDASSPGVCEPSSILKSRADSERSPLHDVKQHAHCQASLGGRESFTCGRAKRAVASAAFLFFARTLLGGHAAAKSLAPEPEQKRMPTRSFETTAIMRAKPQTPVRAERRSVKRRIVTADLVEPDGIEPTTSCLQSRRSPN